MKKKLLTILPLLLLVSLSLASLSPIAHAAPTCNGVETSIDFHCDDYDTDGISSILMYIINFMAIGVGIAVVIGIIIGGIKYSMSDGEESKAKEGKEIITNSIIGLFLFLFLYAGVDFIVPGGAFNLNEKPKAVASKPDAGKPSTSKPSTSKPSTSKPSTSTTTPSTTTPNTTTPSATPKLSKVPNFRDAGTATGAIKTGVLFRSGLLANASSADKDALAKLLKGGKIIDLRTEETRKKAGEDPSLVGVSHMNVPIVGTTNYTKFVDGSLGDKSSASFGKALKAIAYEDGPVLVHCSAGKDRTGWIVAMAMYAVGASDSQVMTEYLKSKPANVSTKMLNTGLSAVKKKYGTIQKYLTNGLGLTSSDIAALKKRLAV